MHKPTILLRRALVFILIAAIGPAALCDDRSSGSLRAGLSLCGYVEPRVELKIEAETEGKQGADGSFVLESRGTLRGGV